MAVSLQAAAHLRVARAAVVERFLVDPFRRAVDCSDSLAYECDEF